VGWRALLDACLAHTPAAERQAKFTVCVDPARTLARFTYGLLARIIL